MWYRETLDDAYDRHQRRVRDLTQEAFEIPLTETAISRPRWYNGLLSRVGHGLMVAGANLKERNGGGKSIILSTLPR